MVPEGRAEGSAGGGSDGARSGCDGTVAEEDADSAAGFGEAVCGRFVGFCWQLAKNIAVATARLGKIGLRVRNRFSSLFPNGQGKATGATLLRRESIPISISIAVGPTMKSA